MKKVLEALEEIYLDEFSFRDDIENRYSPAILEYLLDVKLATSVTDSQQRSRIHVTIWGKSVLKEYEFID